MSDQQANYRRGFRFLLAADWVLLLAFVVAYLVSRRHLPVELQSWLDARRRDPQSQVSTVRLMLDLLYVVAHLAVSVGLFTFRRWAKSLLIPVTVIGYLIVNPRFIIVEFQWVDSIKSVIGLVYGLIVALVFFSPLATEFDGRAAG